MSLKISESLTSPSTVLRQLKDLSPPELSLQLHSLLLPAKYAPLVARMDTNELQVFVDIIDQALNNPRTEFYPRGHDALQRICGQRELLPTSHILADGLEKTGGIPMSSGEFGDVWSGSYKGLKVAIKVLRMYEPEAVQAVQKLFCKEVVVWRRLQHPNILPFLGISTTVFRLCMVTEWMSNGNIGKYISNHPKANRLKLSMDVAIGLEFLHTSNIIHGNLKGTNILIKDDGHACLADFGMANIMNDPHSIDSTLSGPAHGSSRWTAPELMDPEQLDSEITMPTNSSDIYAMGMVMLEILSGNVPFYGQRKEVVIFKVIQGIRPPRPDRSLEYGMSDEIWDLIQKCWVAQPQQRPDISYVLSVLRSVDSTVSGQPRSIPDESLASSCRSSTVSNKMISSGRRSSTFISDSKPVSPPGSVRNKGILPHIVTQIRDRLVGIFGSYVGRCWNSFKSFGRPKKS